MSGQVGVGAGVDAALVFGGRGQAVQLIVGAERDQLVTGFKNEVQIRISGDLTRLAADCEDAGAGRFANFGCG
ncbi:MAG: hypothetical protein OXO50_06845 [Caldilineaceae bacterium]|nr:hypothetical protein [Caldilineaceae bacterium]